MRRRGLLSLSEALRVLQELPSDSELEHADSSDTEEYTPKPLMVESDDDIDDDLVSNKNIKDDDLSEPGPSLQPQIPTWNSKFFKYSSMKKLNIYSNI
jgi:hypothetical protein